MMILRLICLFGLLLLAACGNAQTSDNLSNNIDWLNQRLVNAATGENFTLASLAGKTIFLEPMATWCTNCRAQQGEVAQAMAALGTEDYVFISMSVESNVSNADLTAYALANNFPQIFVVASPEMLEAMVAYFGRTILNPPSTPHFVIAPDGSISNLSTGQHSASTLIEKLSAANG